MLLATLRTENCCCGRHHIHNSPKIDLLYIVTIKVGIENLVEQNFYKSKLLKKVVFFKNNNLVVKSLVWISNAKKILYNYVYFTKMYLLFSDSVNIKSDNVLHICETFHMANIDQYINGLFGYSGCSVTFCTTVLPEAKLQRILENKGGLDVTDYGQFGELMMGERQELVLWIQ